MTSNPVVKREALGRLLATYLPALRAHLLIHKQLRVHTAEDLLQGFICDQVVADDLIKRADRVRGRFRAFVLVALDRYVARVRRADTAAKRRPKQRVMSLTPNEASALEPAPVEDGANAFDLAWAREVVQRAIAQMRSRCEQSAELSGKQRLWRVFDSVALQPLLNGVEPPTHEQLVEQLGFDCPQQVSNTLVTAKRMFARVVREVVGEYATDDDEIELELQDLFNVLSRVGATADRRVSGRDPH